MHIESGYVLVDVVRASLQDLFARWAVTPLFSASTKCLLGKVKGVALTGSGRGKAKKTLHSLVAAIGGHSEAAHRYAACWVERITGKQLVLPPPSMPAAAAVAAELLPAVEAEESGPPLVPWWKVKLAPQLNQDADGVSPASSRVTSPIAPAKNAGFIAATDDAQKSLEKPAEGAPTKASGKRASCTKPAPESSAKKAKFTLQSFFAKSAGEKQSHSP